MCSRVFTYHTTLLFRTRTVTLLARKSGFELRDRLSRASEDVAKPEAPSLDANAPDKEVHQRPIADAESKEDAEVSPLVVVADVQR